MPMSPQYGLCRIAGSGDDRAVVIVHGIRQTREALADPFGYRLAEILPAGTSIYVYGYNYNDALVDNGTALARAIQLELGGRDRIDIVGYSMGGLVARLAVMDRPNVSINTVVTLATPNTGAMSNAELATLGQIGLNMLQFISPLWPRAAGILDLTRASTIMKDQANEMKSKGRTLEHVRYASIPAIFYNDQRCDTELGPTPMLTGLQAVLFAANLKRKIMKMPRSHDGIVTETSNDLTRGDMQIRNEMQIIGASGRGPHRLHATVDDCLDQDHSSILEKSEPVRLVAAILECVDWTNLAAFDPLLKHSIKSRMA